MLYMHSAIACHKEVIAYAAGEIIGLVTFKNHQLEFWKEIPIDGEDDDQERSRDRYDGTKYDYLNNLAINDTVIIASGDSGIIRVLFLYLYYFLRCMTLKLAA